MNYKIIIVSLLLTLTGCASSDVGVIYETKPELSNDKKEQRKSFIGKWESKQKTKSGGTRHTIIERLNDSRYVIEHKVFNPKSELERHQKEFGYWGVSGGIYFTMFRGWINDDNLTNSDPTNAYNYDSYEIEEISSDKLVYKSLSSGNLFTYTKVH